MSEIQVAYLEQLVRESSREVPVVKLKVEELVLDRKRLVVGICPETVCLFVCRAFFWVSRARTGNRTRRLTGRRPRWSIRLGGFVEKVVHRFKRVEHELMARSPLLVRTLPRITRRAVVEPVRDGAVGLIPSVGARKGEVDHACQGRRDEVSREFRSQVGCKNSPAVYRIDVYSLQISCKRSSERCPAAFVKSLATNAIQSGSRSAN